MKSPKRSTDRARGPVLATVAETDSVGIQSIEVGAALLRALADSPGPMTLTTLAAAAAMPTSKAHKYLASFIRCGLVRQTGPAGRYGLGPLAAELGFAALRGTDVVALAQETLDALRDELGTVVSMAVWANRGATIVRRAEHRQAVTLIVQLGAVMPLLTSAGGRVFAAWLDRTATADLMRAALADPETRRAGIAGMRDVDALIADVRRLGFAAIAGTVHRGIAALSAPVFDYTGGIVAALTLIELEGALDLGADGRPARELKAKAAALSWRLGARGAGHAANADEGT